MDDGINPIEGDGWDDRWLNLNECRPASICHGLGLNGERAEARSEFYYENNVMALKGDHYIYLFKGNWRGARMQAYKT